MKRKSKAGTEGVAEAVKGAIEEVHAVARDAAEECSGGVELERLISANKKLKSQIDGLSAQVKEMHDKVAKHVQGTHQGDQGVKEEKLANQIQEKLAEAEKQNKALASRNKQLEEQYSKLHNAMADLVEEKKEQANILDHLKKLVGVSVEVGESDNAYFITVSSLFNDKCAEIELVDNQDKIDIFLDKLELKEEQVPVYFQEMLE